MDDRSALIEAELDAMYHVAQVLNSTQDLRAKLHDVLEVLHSRAGMRSGMIALREVENDTTMVVCAVHDDDTQQLSEPVRYQPGEGLIGAILDAGETIVVDRLCDEPRFLGRL